MSYVSISEAARMVGIKSRSTFYRHLKTKGISISNDDQGQPRINVSELIRVYGSKVKMPEQGGEKLPKDTRPAKHPSQDETSNDKTQLEVLKERVMHLQSAKETGELERRKERELYQDQISDLRKILTEEQGQNKRLTALISDQSGSERKKEEVREDRITQLEKTIMELKAANDQMLAREEERRKRVQERKEAKVQDRKKGYFGRLFGK